mmetsp:Transcript_9345/g.56942  ORF Transcript_9345/g.56942 Transcript_9345/m.56942 type:complete len:214 (-) Transcript_9345:985-1626(-)
MPHVRCAHQRHRSSHRARHLSRAAGGTKHVRPGVWRIRAQRCSGHRALWNAGLHPGCKGAFPERPLRLRVIRLDLLRIHVCGRPDCLTQCYPLQNRAAGARWWKGGAAGDMRACMLPVLRLHAVRRGGALRHRGHTVLRHCHVPLHHKEPLGGRHQCILFLFQNFGQTGGNVCVHLHWCFGFSGRPVLEARHVVSVWTVCNIYWSSGKCVSLR